MANMGWINRGWGRCSSFSLPLLSLLLGFLGSSNLIAGCAMSYGCPPARPVGCISLPSTWLDNKFLQGDFEAVFGPFLWSSLVSLVFRQFSEEEHFEEPVVHHATHVPPFFRQTDSADDKAKSLACNSKGMKACLYGALWWEAYCPVICKEELMYRLQLDLYPGLLKLKTPLSIRYLMVMSGSESA